MKIKFFPFFLVLICSISFISCNEDKDSSIEFINESKIQQIIEMVDNQEQKLAYSLLNKNEKYSLWQQKFEIIINSKYFNEGQNQLIKKIKNDLISDIFLEDDDSQIYFKNVSIPNYLKTLKKEFNNEDIGFIFYTLDSYRSLKKDVIKYEDNEGGGTGQSKSCDCNRNSMWSCTWWNTSTCLERAELNGCKILFDGCGFMNSYSCNGKCKPTFAKEE
tara:strand:- start:604 stop:1257 length:654 start_codon:yes stop_codon:yes gene_type:complete